MRCLSVLDLVILFYLFIFFLGREAQKVREWGVNSLVFCRKCEVFVCLGFGHFILFVCFFPWPRSSKGPRMGRQFFKNVDFSLPTPLRGCRSLLEIVFCRTV